MSLIIRVPRESDFDDLMEIWSQPEVVARTGLVPGATEDFVRSRVSGLPDNVHSLVASRDGKVVAQGGLTVGSGRRAHAAELALLVHSAHWGQGVGTAVIRALIDLADTWLGLRRLQLDVLSDHARAIALYERMGFEHEGTLRGAQIYEGRLCDLRVMARLRPALPMEKDTT